MPAASSVVLRDLLASGEVLNEGFIGLIDILECDESYSVWRDHPFETEQDKLAPLKAYLDAQGFDPEWCEVKMCNNALGWQLVKARAKNLSGQKTERPDGETHTSGAYQEWSDPR